MPRSGGKGKGGPKKGGENIGRALIKMHLQGTGKLKPRYANNMVSILEGNNLDDFIDTAEMEGNDFEVKRVHQNHAFLMEATTHRAIQTLSFSAFGHEQLSIPRKPAWTKTMTAEEVDRNEKNAFLQWRRDIAAVESNDDYTKKVTPFEKNLEVWRQLWRVCERSDLVIQIVDARNPLLYYTRDLMKYVSELQPAKKMILLVNKADFLTEYQRLVWAQYFTAIGVRFVFYSAFIEQSKLDAFGLVEDFEESDVNEDEVRWLASDLVSTYATDAAERATEGLVFDPTSAESYLADQRTRAEETAAAQAILEKDRRGAIPATVEEQDEEEESDSEDEGESDSEASTADANTKADASATAPATAQPAVESENATNEAEEENEDNFIDYVQKTQVSKLRQPVNSAEASDSDEASETEDADHKDSVSPKPSVAFGGVTTAPRVSVSGDQRRARLLTRGELILLLEVICDELRLVPQDRHDGRVCVGLVGYPNVGKSSCINTLLGVSKSSHGKVRVGVSSTPGKTKHFQTLILSDSVLLCDCPGLVFPSFMNSTGEMLCAGMLPINQMRDYQEPAAVIASRIPQYLLEASLGIKIYRHLDPLDKKDRPPTPSEMLSSYCDSRGYITNGTGRWDEFRACKDMLVWYTDGKLLNVAVPPFDNLAAPTGQVATAAGAPVPAAPSLGKMAADHMVTSGDSPLRASLLARWVKETEKVMVRRSRVAERVSEQNNKSAAAAAALALEMLTLEESNGSGLTQANLTKNTQHTHGGMVFEYATATNPGAEEENEQAVRTDANGYEFVDDESSEDGLSGEETATTAHGVPRREHKRLKTWGKKNRKLRSKDPYNDVNNLVAYSTNRVKGTAAPVVTTGREKEKLMRQSPQTAYGSPFVRAVLPHHTTSAAGSGVAGGSVAGSVQGSVRK